MPIRWKRCGRRFRRDYPDDAPESFRVSEAERVWMSEQGVDLAALDGVGSTGEELADVLARHCPQGQEITFLLGGCLPLAVPRESDMIGIFETDLEPALPVEAYGAERDLVWAGLFPCRSRRCSHTA